MPLKQTFSGAECPLGKFHVNLVGRYDCDPVNHCIPCNFSDHSSETFDLEKVCQCPSDITKEKYEQLKFQYLSLENPNFTKEQFQDFVKKNYK